LKGDEFGAGEYPCRDLYPLLSQPVKEKGDGY